MILYTLENEFIKESDYIPDNFIGIVKNFAGSQTWWFDGKLHRTDGPAGEYSNGTKNGI